MSMMIFFCNTLVFPFFKKNLFCRLCSFFQFFIFLRFFHFSLSLLISSRLFFYLSFFFPLFFGQERRRQSFPPGKIHLWAGLCMSPVCDVTKQSLAFLQLHLICKLTDCPVCWSINRTWGCSNLHIHTLLIV